LEARVATLEAQNQRYQTTLDAISQGVAFFDREQRLIACNRRYAEIYRLTPDQIPPGTTLREIAERRTAAGACPMAVDDYLAYVGSIDSKREDHDWSVRLDDGRAINVRYQPMADGGWISIHEDVTDLREKRLLIEERVSLQSLIDVVPDNLWVKDVESRFVVANRATALRMGHASPQELIGKSDLELCPWETAQKYLADEREVIETGRPMIDGEEYVLSPDGEKFWIATTKAPLRNAQGDVIGIIGVSRDITRRRLADALREGQAEILQMIVGGAPVENVLEELVHLVESQSNGTAVAIVPLEDKGRKLPGAVSSLTEIAGLSGQLLAGPLAETIRLSDSTIVPDIASAPAWAEQRQQIGALGLRACWSTPIMSQDGEALGVLAVFARAAREPTEAEIKLAHVTAHLAAIAIGRNDSKAAG
jgi:PAS domain S-box-containing protein